MDYTSTMGPLTKKILTLALLLSFAVARTAFAQDASSTPVTPASTDPSSAVPPVITIDTPATPSTSTPTDASTTPSDTLSSSTASSTSGQSVDLQGSTATLQDTTNTQSAASSTLLEHTTDPSTATSTDVVTIPVVDASTGTSSDPLPVTVTPPATTDATTPVDQGASTLDVVAQNVDPVTPVATATSTPTPVGVPHITVLPLADLTPQPAYTFALTGTSIPSTRTVKDASGAVVGEETVTTPLVSSVATTTSAVSVSGQCSDAYFVVLLFKNATDYAEDPRSYIVNRAYPCVNGAFTYSISELPGTLADGTYYLLVGQEGKRGTWEPITEMTEITITKKH